MASIANDPNGFRRLIFVDGEGKRRTVRLGKCTSKQAHSIKLKVEAVISATITGHPLSGEVSAWIADLPGILHGRFAKAGLIESRDRTSATLKAFLDDVFAAITVK